MIRLIAAAGFALALTASAQAMTLAPMSAPTDMITQIRFGCGPGRTLVAGRCVSRAAIRRQRRCLRWTGRMCSRWGWW